MAVVAVGVVGLAGIGLAATVTPGTGAQPETVGFLAQKAGIVVLSLQDKQVAVRASQHSALTALSFFELSTIGTGDTKLEAGTLAGMKAP